MTGLTGSLVRRPWALALVVGALLVGLLIASGVEASDPPPAPTDLSATVATSGIELSWSAPTLDPGEDAPTGYDVEMRKTSAAGDSEWETIAEDVSDTEYTSTELLMTEQTYEFRVSAVYSEDSSSDPSDSVSITAPGVSKPGSLTKTRTTSGIDLAWTAPTLSWTGLALTLSGYVIERDSWYTVSHPELGQDYTSEELDTAGSDATSYTDTSTVNTRTYGYSIYAVYGYVRSNDQDGDFVFLQGVGTE
ncbi:MAG: fibronectin type III domain-containing protein [Chloroflexi bacterium]|nr:fibronectin type III domain-containing protein [Chloroflexota bacterium]MYG90834.1 fibronectin type III domain-containing protein [Chloroflexota bacterium]MYJ93885.1 fibronectin type III domain-containing protein [Chloroflexota bacterium]